MATRTSVDSLEFRTRAVCGPFFGCEPGRDALDPDGVRAVVARVGPDSDIAVSQWHGGERPILEAFIPNTYGGSWESGERPCPTDTCCDDDACDGSCEVGPRAEAIERARYMAANSVAAIRRRYQEYLSEERVAGRRPGITAAELRARIARAHAAEVAR